jgi:2-oxoglutarate ferredoxin oxidoreductase subunit alpha
VCRTLRGEGHRVGWIRPISLVPFPSEVIARSAARARAIVVYENNRGQMIDDVRLAVLGRCPVHSIGRLSLDESGFGIAPDLDVEVLAGRMRRVLDELGITPPSGSSESRQPEGAR